MHTVISKNEKCYYLLKSLLLFYFKKFNFIVQCNFPCHGNY